MHEPRSQADGFEFAANPSPLAVTRRWFLGECALGVGSMAVASLVARDARAQSGTDRAPSDDPFAPKSPHFAPRAKRIVYLHMAGAPSQLDLFDPKPKLVE